MSVEARPPGISFESIIIHEGPSWETCQLRASGATQGVSWQDRTIWFRRFAAPWPVGPAPMTRMSTSLLGQSVGAPQVALWRHHTHVLFTAHFPLLSAQSRIFGYVGTWRCTSQTAGVVEWRRVRQWVRVVCVKCGGCTTINFVEGPKGSQGANRPLIWSRN